MAVHSLQPNALSLPYKNELCRCWVCTCSPALCLCMWLVRIYSFCLIFPLKCGSNSPIQLITLDTIMRSGETLHLHHLVQYVLAPTLLDMLVHIPCPPCISFIKKPADKFCTAFCIASEDMWPLPTCVFNARVRFEKGIYWWVPLLFHALWKEVNSDIKCDSSVPLPSSASDVSALPSFLSTLELSGLSQSMGGLDTVSMMPLWSVNHGVVSILPLALLLSGVACCEMWFMLEPSTLVFFFCDVIVVSFVLHLSDCCWPSCNAWAFWVGQDILFEDIVHDEKPIQKLGISI